MIERRLVTAGLKALLADLTGRPVGVRTVPLDAAGKPVPPPYTLLYPLDHIVDDATLADRHTTAMSEYQATFVSGPLPGIPDSRGGDEQAQWLADRGRKVIARPADGSPGYLHPLTIPGVNCWRREAIEAGGTSEANDAIITSVIRFRLYLEQGV
ncbi:hypothetical protein ACFW9D_05585 [Streptomyces sp. NPDC059524]|uniref:hypothetical protein n=1 Tax=Streptomyces sp. NPDC059524 TaxID=3346856 RepID=UPI0036CC419C